MQDDIRDRYRTPRRPKTAVPPTPRPATLAAEEPKPVAKEPKKSRKKLLFRLLAVVIIIAVATSTWWYFSSKGSGPIPKKIRQSVNFSLYYPSQLPAGYSLDKSSVKFSNQIVFFNLKSVDNTINISEQTAPANPPDFATLEKFNTSFKSLDVIGGKAIYGTAESLPVAFLLSNTTLVNISGTKNTPLDAVAKTTQSMSPL